MHYLNWKDQYQHMGKPPPRPRKLMLNKIKLILCDKEKITITVNKEIKNILKKQPIKVSFELRERKDKFFKTYCLSSNKKKKK